MRRFFPHAATFIPVLLLLLSGGARGAESQDVRPTVSREAGAGGSAPLTFDHWSYELLEALDVAGVASSWMTGVRPTGREVVRGELRRVRENGFARGSLRDAVGAWTRRFDRELGSGRSGSRRELGSGASGSEGEIRLAAGVRSGDAFLDPGGGAFTALGGSFSPTSRTALWGEADLGGRDRFGGVQAAGFTLPVGAFSLMAGRQRIKAAGPGWTSTQLGGEIPLDALYVVSDRRVSVKGTRWLLGSLSWHFALAPRGGIGDLERGWIGMGGVIAEPHPRLRLGATRTAQFGPGALTEVRTDGVTPDRFLRMFFVVQNDPSYWDDQKLELSLRYRWGLFGQPLGSYVVLAQEDSPLWKDPGILIGTSAPFALASGLYNLRYEYTAYGKRARWCPGCEYARGEHGDRFQAPWYDHGNFERYEVEGIPRGDPLGGYGSNHKMSLAFWSMDGRTRARAWTFFELREEGNLLFERWPGKRRGGGVELARELRTGIEASFTGLVADGPALDREFGLRLSLSAVFGGER